MSARGRAKQGMTLILVLTLWGVVPGAGALGQEGGSPEAEVVTTDAAPRVEAMQSTGTAAVRVPLALPAGRAGLAPTLALTYSSYGTNGWLGLGFALELGAIQRSTKHGLDYAGRQFTVQLGGATAELVERPDWGAGVFGARTESGFTRYRDLGGLGWEALSKDGRRYYFGITEAGRQADTSNPARVFRWCLERVEDSNGNFITISYFKDLGEIYPQRIDYTGHRSLPPVYRVEFFFEERPDAIESVTAHFVVTTGKRLRSIVIRTGAQPIRGYQISYRQSPSTGRSLLSTVTPFGSDLTWDAAGTLNGSRLPPTAFEYRDGKAAVSRVFSTKGLGGYDFSSLRDVALPFDFDGDGNGDIFVYRLDSNKACVLRGNGEGGFKAVLDSHNGIGGYPIASLRDRGLPLDFDGDGRQDLFFYRVDTTLCGALRSQGDGSFAGRITPDGIAGLKFHEKDKVQALDVDGDGRSDLLVIGPNRVVVMRSNGDGSFAAEVFPDFFGYGVSEKDRCLIFDFNGDGRSDVMLYRPDDGKTGIFRSRGDGRFEAVYSSHKGLEGFSFKGGSDRAAAINYNGDAHTDLLLYRGGYALLVRSNGDGSFTAQASLTLPAAGPISLPGSGGSWDGNGPPPTQPGTFDQPLVFDVNGDGLQDLLWESRGSSDSLILTSDGRGGFVPILHSTEGLSGLVSNSTLDRVFALDFDGDGLQDLFYYRPDGERVTLVKSGSVAPDLLSSVKNALGGLTEISYTSSSRIENHLLPFIVHPVSEIRLVPGMDEAGAMVSRYAYSGGRYDCLEREFRGFERIVQQNPDGTVVETSYHQERDLQGKIRTRQNFSGPGGVLLSRTQFNWQASAQPGGRAVFVRLAGKHGEIYDGATVRSSEQYAYDETNGTLLTTLVAGEGAESLLKRTVWRNFGDWLIRPVSESLEGAGTGKQRETLFEYERGTGNLCAKELWLAGGSNPKTTIEYDVYGNPVTVKDPLGHETHTEYDEETRTLPVRMALPKTGKVAHVRQTAYDLRFGKPVSATDENGSITRYHYDVFGRLIRTEQADGGESFMEYRFEQTPACIVSGIRENAEGGAIRRLQYVDGLGRLIQEVGFGEKSRPVVTRLFYDAMGRNSERYGPYYAAGSEYPQPLPERGPWSRTTFDPFGRPAAVETPDAEHGLVKAVFAYDGLSATATDADGASRTERRDYLGRVIEVVEHADGGDALTSYAYNAAGDLVSVTNAAGAVTTMAYDSLGRKIGMSDADMGRWGYTYDAAGRMISQTDAKDQEIRFVYDALGRVVKKSYSSGESTVSFSYDGAENGIGRLHQVSNANAATLYRAYDAAGRVTEVCRRLKGAPRTEYTTAYRYDVAGRLSAMIYPDSYQVSYDYHPGTQLLRSVFGITDFTEFAELESHDAAGRVGYIYHGNGTASVYDFDPASGRLVSLSTQDPQLMELQKKTYQYSPAGDIVVIGETAAAGGVLRSYRYDRLHRLVAESSSGGPPASPSERVTPLYDEGQPFNGPNRIVAGNVEYTIRYDANGNMLRMPDLSDPSRVRERFFTYNADNMPIRISYDQEGPPGPGGGGGGSRPSGGGGGCFIGAAHAADGRGAATVELFYDGEGRRVLKIAHGTRRIFTIGPHFEVAEGFETKYVFAGGRRIAIVSAAARHFTHGDHLGSATVVTDESTGAAVETADYEPFGLMRSHSGEAIARHKYTGQEHDAETGLYNYNARLYDPALGVFITPDTIVQNPFDPQTLNRYAYCRNNPLSYTDPSGHDFGLTAVVVGAIIGAAISGMQSGWDPGSMIIGACIGAVSGYMGFVGNAMGIEAAMAAGFGETATSLAGATIGGAMAGATSGGVSAAVYGGDVGQGILRGAGIGAVTGFSFGAVDSFYSGRWTIDRVVAHTAVGGGLSELSGGKLSEDALFALTTSFSAFTYNSIVGYGLTWEPGGEAVEKRPWDPPIEKANNTGTQGESLDPNGWFNEGGRVSRVANQIPGVNATAGLHDMFQITIDKISGTTNGVLRTVLCVPGMVPAAVITYAGLMSGSSPTIYYFMGR